MAKALIQVEGLRDVQKAIRRLGDEDSRDALKAAHREGADQVLAVTRPPVASGLLASTLRAAASVQSGRVAAGRKAVPYAGPIHFGWGEHGIEPQPFIYDALDQRRDDVVHNFENQYAQIAAKVNQSGAHTP